MTKDEIKAKLDAAGIEYDARLGAEKLAELLPEEPAPEPKAQTVTCRVLRDYWPTDNDEDRVRAGAIVELDPMEAIDAIEAGAVARVK